ncbi:MAG: DUF262 domain-containing protein [Anaerolineales bacterium]|nr:MAG: DUF262 domain-containing protein [Anaerolineales bacterium]
MAKTEISIRELVNKVEREELLLPEMQRKYVWTSSRVRDLMDSLYRNYPSGNILVWETDSEVVTRDLAVRPDKHPTTNTQQLLLDGQQRITSLAALLTGKSVQVRNSKKSIDILFNLNHPEGPPSDLLEIADDAAYSVLEEQEDDDAEMTGIQEELKRRAFVVSSNVLKANPNWVSVSDIFTRDRGELLREAGVSSFDDPNYPKFSERLQKVKDIEKYTYSMHILDSSMSYEEVTEIFVRVNSLGVKLRGSDLALAQITSKWPGFIKEMEDFVEQFDHDADFLFDWVLVRLTTVFATQQSRFKTIGRISRAELEQAWKRTKESLEFTVNFLRNNAKVESLNFLSAAFLIIPIAVYTDLSKQKLSSKEEKELLKWLYLAHLRGHYSGSAESSLDADLTVLFKQGSLKDLLSTLLGSIKKTYLDVEEIAGKSIRSPIFTMLYFVLRNNKAKDWLSGLELSERVLGEANKIEKHHIFPKSLLAKRGLDKREINEIANIAFISGKTNRRILDKEPNEYFTKEIIPKRGEEALTSQLVPMNKELWQLENFNAFLDFRRAKIAECINDFLKKYD